MNPVMDQSVFVMLSIYMHRDFAEVARVAQTLVRQPIQIERFNADLVPRDVSSINGLEKADFPVIRLVVAANMRAISDVEHTTKSLNRIVSVVKVIAEYA